MSTRDVYTFPPSLLAELQSRFAKTKFRRNCDDKRREHRHRATTNCSGVNTALVPECDGSTASGLAKYIFKNDTPGFGSHVDDLDQMQIETLSDTHDEVLNNEGRTPDIGSRIDHQDQIQTETPSDTRNEVSDTRDKGFDNETILANIPGEKPGNDSHTDPQTQIQIETQGNARDEVLDNKDDNTMLRRCISPGYLRWWGLEPLTDDEKRTGISPLWCTSMCVRRPLFLLAVAIIPIAVLSIMGLTSEAHLNLGVDQFSLSNQDCRIQRNDMLESARNDATKAVADGKEDGLYRRRLASKWTVLARLEVMYFPKKGDNILTEANFKEIHRIERAVLRRPDYAKYCYRPGTEYGDYRDCQYQSLMTYFFPSIRKSDGKAVYDGLSEDMLPMDATLQALSGVKSVRYFLDESADLAEGKASFVKALFLFAAHTELKTSEIYKETMKEFKPWLVGFKDILGGVGSDQVRVVHGGDIITEAEIEEVVFRDARFAVMSFVFVLAYSIWYLRSFFLALLGIMQIMCTLPITFYVCRLLNNVPGYADLTELGVMNVLSLYLLLGIGVDDLYIMADAFRQAKQTVVLDDGTVVPVTNRLRHNYTDTQLYRMSYAFRRSARAMFLTSLTTAVAFLANMTIIIPVIYQFVLFMALLIIINYVLAVTVFPLLLSVREKYLKRDCCGRPSCEQRFGRC